MKMPARKGLKNITAREMYHLVRRGLARQRPDRSWIRNERRLDQEYDYYSLLRKRLGLRPLSGRLLELARLVRRALLIRAEVIHQSSLTDRLMERRRRTYLTEIANRGLPTHLDLAKNGRQELRIAEYGTVGGYPVMLLHADGEAQYGSSWRDVYPKSLSILCGEDDAGLWAVRVPGTITSLHVALAWLEPAAVRRAREAGKRVLRQGDVWLVERRADAMDRLPRGHRWDPETRMLYHGHHQALHVPFPVMAIPQSTLAGSGVGRWRGD